VKAHKTSGGRKMPVRHTIPLGIVIFLVGNAVYYRFICYRLFLLPGRPSAVVQSALLPSLYDHVHGFNSSANRECAYFIDLCGINHLCKLTKDSDCRPTEGRYCGPGLSTFV